MMKKRKGFHPAAILGTAGAACMSLSVALAHGGILALLFAALSTLFWISAIYWVGKL